MKGSADPSNLPSADIPFMYSGSRSPLSHLSLLLLGVLLSATAQAQTTNAAQQGAASPDAAKRAVRSQLAKMDAAEMANDPTAMAAFYMPHFTLDSRRQMSREEWLNEARSGLKSFHYVTVKDTVVDMQVTGDTVVATTTTSGKVRMTDAQGHSTDQVMTDQGDVTTWVKSGRTWLIADMRPASAPKPPKLLTDFKRESADGRPGAASDAFDDAPNTALKAQGGGDGWADRWDGDGPTVSGSGLPDPSGKLAASGHSVVARLRFNTEVVVGRNLNFSLGRADTTEWISFTICRTAGATHGYGGLTLGDMYGGLHIGDTGDGRWGINSAGGGGAVADAGPIVSGRAAFLVVRADFKSGTDTFTLYQDPTPGLASPNVTGVVKSDIKQTPTSLIELVFGSFNRAGDQVYTVGNLRLGTTYEAVAPSGPAAPL